MHGKALDSSKAVQYLPGSGNGRNCSLVEGVNIGLSQSSQHGACDDAIVHALGLGLMENQGSQLFDSL